MPLNGYELAGKTTTVFNTAGVKVLQKTLTTANEKLNLSALPAGVYILTVGQGADRKVIKLIKI